MAGGGKSVSRNRMGTSVKTHTRKSLNVSSNSADVQNLETQRDQLQQELDENRSRQVSLESLIQQSTEELRSYDVNFQKLSMEVNSLKEAQPTILKQLEEQGQKVANTHTDQSQVAQLQKEIDEYESAYKNAVSGSQKIEKEVKLVNDKMNELKDNLLNSLGKEIKNITKSIEKLTTECSRLKVEIQTSERNIIKSKNSITKLEGEIKTCEQTIFKLREENTELEKHAADLLEDTNELDRNIEENEKIYATHKSGFSELDKKIATLKLSRVDLEQENGSLEKMINEIAVTLSAIKKYLSKLKLEAIPYNTDPEHNILKVFTDEELAEVDVKNLKYRSETLEEKLQKATPNLQAIEEYKNKETQYLKRVAELESLTDQRNELRDIKDKLCKDRFDGFMTGFKIISHKLKELYQIITMGGDAELDLVDSMMPFGEGVVFNVRPVKKSWKAISDLSGGEKTLASLSLVLALHYYKPSPLYVMDEIDAALDFRNVSIVANYIKDRTKNAQFIIISLRSNMFELCDRMVSIYKTNDCTGCMLLNNDIVRYMKIKDSVIPSKVLPSALPSQDTHKQSA